MPNEYNLATPLASNASMKAIVQVVREEIERIDYSRLFVYLFETVDESLLDILAAQFDMLGFNGWILADSVQAKRELLKGAFELHLLKGTPGGIREVVKRLGYLDVEIEEGWENFTDGSTEPDINSWAYFRVKYLMPPDKPIDEDISNKLSGLINNYKNARSVLANFSLVTPVSDYLMMKGEVYMKVIDVATDAIISEETISNWIHPRAIYLLMNGFRFLSAEETESVGESRIKFISFGTNGTEFKPTSIDDFYTITGALKRELSSNPNIIGTPHTGSDKSLLMNGGSIYDSSLVRHFFELPAGEGNGMIIREMGLVINRVRTGQPDEEYILSRIIRAPLVKTSAIRIEGYWDLRWFPNQTPE